MPLEVGRHPKDKLVVDLTPAAHAHGRPGLLWQGRAQGPRQARLPDPGRPWPLQPQPNPPSLALPLLEVRPQGNQKLWNDPENRKRKQHNLLTFPLSPSLNTGVVSVQLETELTGGRQQHGDTEEPRTPPCPHCRLSPDFRPLPLPLTATPSYFNTDTAAFSPVPS